MTPRLKSGSTGSFAFGHMAPSNSKSQSSQARKSGGFSPGCSLVVLRGAAGCAEVGVGVAFGSCAGWPLAGGLPKELC